mmetsp:Transcript_8748/g.9265  ORF Transcript_8748/g.9265 Transcript_8748/m.9265 type:complete len:315 (+) Transcript_8748:47-991(+)
MTSLTIPPPPPKKQADNTQVTARSYSDDSYDLRDIITQTDKDGKPVIPNRNSSRQSKLTTQKEIDEIVPEIDVSPKKSFLQRFFCCFSKPDETPKHRPKSAQLTRTPSTIHPRRVCISGDSKLLPDLPVISDGLKPKKCLVLDLDETLVHSSFQYVSIADFVVPVVIEGVTHNVYVIKRPGAELFLQRMSLFYEIVIYTASLNKYADPLLDILDTHKVIYKRLFRESCVYHEGSYVKDLSLLNRDLSQCIIVDNSPLSYLFHPENAIDCTSFINDPDDREMWQIGDFLEHLHQVDDVRGQTRLWREWCQSNNSC